MHKSPLFTCLSLLIVSFLSACAYTTSMCEKKQKEARTSTPAVKTTGTREAGTLQGNTPATSRLPSPGNIQRSTYQQGQTMIAPVRQ